MSRIDDLIAEHCPDGVEFIPLADAFYTKNGYTPSKSHRENWENGTVPWIRMDDLRLNGNILSESLQQVNEVAVKGGKLFPKNSIIVATSATIGEHALITVPFLCNQRFTAVWPREEYLERFNMEFLNYYFYKLDEWCKSNTTVSSFASVDMVGFKRWKVPLIPICIQNEIVRLLDKFTQLEAELEAELEARRRQYEYYRDALLTFTKRGGVRLLGDIAKFSYGFTARAMDDGTHRFIRITDIGAGGRINADGNKYVYYHEDMKGYGAGKGDILVARTGATFGKTLIVDDDIPSIYASFLIKIDLNKDVILPKYYWYFAQSDQYWSQANRLVGQGSQPQFNANKLKLIELNIPPLEEQKRIVEFLEPFEALIADLSAGLPAELQARRKQYEYYRDKLLTFKEKA